MADEVKAGYSTPLFHVAEVERSIGFYTLLGFEVVDNDRCEPLGWARLQCDGGALMLLRSEEPVDASVQGVLLYMYTPDLEGLRARLDDGGIDVSKVTRPPYMPRGEVRLTDPDGYAVLVGHWGEEENREWLRRIGGADGGGSEGGRARGGRSSE